MAISLTRMNPTTLPDAGRVGYSQISVIPPSPLAFVSGQVPWRHNGEAVPADLEEQTDIVVENLSHALVALDARPRQIAQMRIYMTDLRPETQEVVMTRLAAFLNGAQPSLTGIGVSALAAPEFQLEIEMVVSLPA
ncbi:Endoribonuclease L-PSP [Rhodobacteraceae bacterium THAF1]|uniref:RidA family protein n=1 Tax=Palleronia sp. THAF1 TaxID=2587842 RepID=UPI000F3CDEDE|nr:RidA family protein [Palleronia sp. THAF1]QFU08715.1 RutC family protein YjgH [Palleronia sp. THAF1]VDC27063.1 Endoribonuclease L-PSP [Rhodobacteraceae bacterium THAF1]